MAASINTLPNFKIRYGSGYFDNAAGGGDIGLTVINTPHPSGAQVEKSVSDILGFTANAATEKMDATAAGYTAQGDTAEAGAYGAAAGLANVNAGLADVAGQIEQYQAARKAAMTIGGETADVSNAGFKMSGSNLASLRSSYQQNYLTDQLIRTQTAMTKSGYLEQAAAATGEQSAAAFAASSATALENYETKSAATDTERATTEYGDLLNQLRSSGAFYTSEGIAAGVALKDVAPPPGVTVPQGWGVDNTLVNKVAPPAGGFSTAPVGGFMNG